MKQINENTFEVELDDAICTKMQRATYEANTKKDVIMLFLNDHANDPTAEAINSPIFKQYEQNYLDAAIAFDKAKADFQNTYIPDEIKKNYSNFSWSIDFSTHKVIITINKNSCGCGTSCNC